MPTEKRATAQDIRNAAAVLDISGENYVPKEHNASIKAAILEKGLEFGANHSVAIKNAMQSNAKGKKGRGGSNSKTATGKAPRKNAVGGLFEAEATESKTTTTATASSSADVPPETTAKAGKLAEVKGAILANLAAASEFVSISGGWKKAAKNASELGRGSINPHRYPVAHFLSLHGFDRTKAVAALKAYQRQFENGEELPPEVLAFLVRTGGTSGGSQTGWNPSYDALENEPFPGEFIGLKFIADVGGETQAKAYVYALAAISLGDDPTDMVYGVINGNEDAVKQGEKYLGKLDRAKAKAAAAADDAE